MTSALLDLEPKKVWKHFEALTKIPRASTKEAAAREYVLAQGKRLGLEAIQDNAGNTVIRKPAHPGRESAPMALLQGHLDMVCEKNEGTLHDFDTDAIQVVRDRQNRHGLPHPECSNEYRQQHCGPAKSRDSSQRRCQESNRRKNNPLENTRQQSASPILALDTRPAIVPETTTASISNAVPINSATRM